VRNYEKWLPLEVKQNYRRQPLLPMIVGSLPMKKENVSSHQWLEIGETRYPALRGLAKFLISKFSQATVFLVTQESNSYSLNDHWRDTYTCPIL
jgi:hypothetical protein